MEPARLLVVDPDAQYISQLSADPAAQRIPVIGFYFGKDAQLVIADKTQKLCGILLHPEVRQTDFFSVLKSALFHRPATPIYMLSDEKVVARFREIDPHRLGMKGTIDKSKVTLSQMLELISPMTVVFDSQKAIEKAKQSGAVADSVGAEVSHEDAQFVGIPAQEFVSGSKSFFDVYVRLGSGKYVKLLQAGDAFTPERIQGYLSKGVTEFFIRKEVQESYVTYCDTLATAMLKKEDLSADIKAGQILSQGGETLSFLKGQGVSEANLRHAVKFVSNVRQFVQQLDAGKGDVMKEFLENLSAADHGSSCTLVASILASALEIQMEKPVQIVGAAAMFHDFGLYALPEKLWEEDESKMSPEERTLYRTHPEKSAQMLRLIRGFDPAAIQAVEQHHMRKGGKGFPASSGMSGMNRVSEIVGIAGDFCRIVDRCQKMGGNNVQSEMEALIFPQFSKQIAYAFRSAFFPRIVGTSNNSAA